MKYTADMKNRLKRVEGQIKGVLRMMEAEKECKEVIYQLTAIRSAVDKATAYIIGKNMEQCLLEQINKGEKAEEVIKEAIQLLVKSR
jgi:DNA-binding FrmR family transcriptional regulator